MKPFSIYILIFIIILLNPEEGQAQQLVINEAQYVNRTTLNDKAGNTPDWIELYNAGNQTISLKNYQITDDSVEADGWFFPAYTLQPGDYLIVFASNQDHIKHGEMHTDFKLGLLQDNIYLKDPHGHTIDHIQAQCVPPDKSISRYPDGSENKVITTPTPGKTNNQAELITLDYQPDSLSINYNSGFYNTPIEIELEHAHAQNKIVYTLDGDELDDQSEPYYDVIILDDINRHENRFADKGDGAFEPGNLISKANILRAQVFSEGCPASNEIANIYFIGDRGRYQYNVPILSLITDENNLFDEKEGIYVKGNHSNYLQRGKAWERRAQMEVFDTSNQQMIDQFIGIRIHGRGSRFEPQKSLRLYARDEYGKSTMDYPFFRQKDISSFETLMLSAEKTFSPVIFKDELCHSLVQEMNMDYQAWQTVVVYINGEYWGIQNLREYQEAEYLRNNHGYQNQGYDLITHEKHNGPEASEGKIDAYQELINYLTMHDISQESHFSEVEKMIDMDNLIDYHIAQLYFANFDFPDNNYRMWKTHDDTTKWRWLFYDCEACMHFVNNNEFTDYTNNPNALADNPEWSVYLFKTLMTNHQFRQIFLSRFHFHLDNTFRSDRVIDQIEQFENLYAPIMAEHIYRWNQPGNIRNWQDNIKTLKQFALQRPVYLKKQLQESYGNPFTVMPNPSNGNFYIHFIESQNNATVNIFSPDGKLQLTTIVHNNAQPLIQTSLAPGIYMMRITMNNHFFTQKIIIQP